MSSECNPERYETIELTVDERGLATLMLNRPQVSNAFDEVMVHELKLALTFVEAQAEIRVLKIAGNGKHFCTGADLNWMRRMVDSTRQQNHADALELAQLMSHLYYLKKPTVVRVQGACFGGGLGLVSCCDVALAEHNARFCLSEVKLGLIPAVISPFVLRALGIRQSRRYMLTAEEMNSEIALNVGLVHEIGDSITLDLIEATILNRLLNNGPDAMTAVKQLIRDVHYSSIDESLQEELADKIATIRVSPEAQEGMAAFLEKRKASYQNV